MPPAVELRLAALREHPDAARDRRDVAMVLVALAEALDGGHFVEAWCNASASHVIVDVTLPCAPWHVRLERRLDVHRQFTGSSQIRLVDRNGRAVQ